MAQETKYTEDNIRSLDWKEHIRMRPGMYIGKLGDGSSPDDGIYILLKEVLDNSIDEYVMGAGKTIEISIRDKQVTVRDYGRGIPLGKVVDVVSKMNTGGKYDSKAFKKSVGLNGVGTKAVNALSTYFKVQSVRDNQTAFAEFEQGTLTLKEDAQESSLRKGTKVQFIPDETIFGKYKFRNEYVAKMLKNYVYLNTGLTIVFNGEKYHSENGLKDLLQENTSESDLRYPIVHLKDDDIEVALTHSKTQYSEEYHSFVNGQHTTQGGTHQAAFREAIVKTIREYFGKNYDASDIRKSIISAIAIKVMEPVFESQTKTKLGSTEMGGGLPTVRTFINDFVKTQLDNYLHKNPDITDRLLKKIVQAEKEKHNAEMIVSIMKNQNQVQIYKFGGASVKEASSIRQVGQIVSQSDSPQLLIVVSAMGKTTNKLESIINHCFRTGEVKLDEVQSLKKEHEDIVKALDLDLSFWFGHQGYEYVDLGRVWQILLLVGLGVWLFLMLRCIAPALKLAKDSKQLLLLFSASTIAIGLFYGGGLFYGARTHISIMEFWRWWLK